MKTIKHVNNKNVCVFDKLILNKYANGNERKSQVII